MQSTPLSGLLDPKWIEERNRQIQERAEQEEVYAAGSSIETSLKHLAERRTDIFGAGTEEAGIGKKVRIAVLKNRGCIHVHKVVWHMLNYSLAFPSMSGSV